MRSAYPPYFSDQDTPGHTTMLRLYDYLPSGNGYKVRLLLTQLDTAFERIELDISQR